MTAHAAVGVDNNFAASESGIAMGSADYESAGGVDVVLGGGIHHVGGNYGIDDVLLYLSAKLFGGNMIVVLRGDHHGVDAFRLAVGIFDADLAFSIGPQKIEAFRPADFAQLPNQLMRHHDGQRHELRSFIACESEHQSLLACAAWI